MQGGQEVPSARRDILVVDDDVDLVEALESLLSGCLEDVQVHMAHSGPEALGILRGQPVDLIVTDYRMPGMDGLQFLAEADRSGTRVPRILVTAFDDELLRDLGKARETFIRKPLDPQPFLEAVLRGLATARSPGRGGGRASDLLSP